MQAAAGSGIKGLEGFAVGLDDEAVEPATRRSRSSATTDAQGTPPSRCRSRTLARPRPLEAQDHPARSASPAAGRSRSLTLPILPDAPVLAIRKGFNGDLQEGGTASFDVVAGRPRRARLAGPPA